jgi:hypothetical protein
MRRDIPRRIERLEQAAGVGEKPLPNLFFHFTDKQASTTAIRAEANGLAWQQEPDEAEKDFQDRVVGDLRSAGHKPPFLVILSDKRRSRGSES